MADRDRAIPPTSAAASTGGPSTSHASGGGGGGAAGAGARFLSRKVWGRASATTKTTTGQDDLTKPSSSLSSQGQGQAQNRGDDVLVPVPTFHLDEAVTLMDPSSTSVSPPELIEHVKATSVYLSNLGQDHKDVFGADIDSNTQSKADGISSEHLRILYTRAVTFGDHTSDIPLRIAGLRLLGSLLVVSPPPRYYSDTRNNHLPDTVNLRSLYQLITTPSENVLQDMKTELTGVQVNALAALTRKGKETEGLGGVVGWLVARLNELQIEWAKWCEIKGQSSDSTQRPLSKLKPFEPIPTPSPLNVGVSLINLIHDIVLANIELFDPRDDIPTLIQSIFSFVCRGISSPVPLEPTGLNTSQLFNRRDSLPPSFLNSPAPTSSINGPILESTVRRSASISRARREINPSTYSTPTSTRVTRQSAVTSPQSIASAIQSPSPHFASTPAPRWLLILPSACAFLEIFIHDTVLKQEQFIDMMRFASICVACDDDANTDVGQIPIYKLLASMFRSNNGRRAEQAIRIILEEPMPAAAKTMFESLVDMENKAVQGAVFITRSLLLHLDDPSLTPVMPTLSLSSIGPSLIGALSTTRFPSTDKVNQSKWESVDYSVLTLLHDYLQRLEHGEAKDIGRGDVWTEGQAACEILTSLLPVASSQRGTSIAHYLGEEPTAFKGIYEAVLHQLPGALDKLLSTPNSNYIFYHPKYIELLLKFGDDLSEEDAEVVIDYYKREGLCLPMTAGWMENCLKLIDIFFLSTLSLPNARRRLVSVLFHDTYASTEEMPECRNELVEKVIVPFLEKVFLQQADEWFREEALQLMIKAAVAETVERDEERRKARAEKAESEVEEEDASALPSQEVKAAAAGGTFHAIRNLIINLASAARCKEDELPIASTFPEKKRSYPISKDKESQPTNSSTLKGLMNVLSPPSRPKDMPPIGASEVEDLPPARTPQPRQSHANCQSLHAVTALITMFNLLSFSPPHSFLSSTAKAARTPASSRCIAIYRDLLALLFSFSNSSTGDSTPTTRTASVSARCPKARVAILQWLMRLRADPRHRVYLKKNVDTLVRPYAETLFRTKEAVDAQRAKMQADLEESKAKTLARQQVNLPSRDALPPRDRVSSSTRSRSRSRPPIDISGDAFNPLWYIPETLAFEMPRDSLPSEGLLTYDPNHPSLRVKDGPPVESVWLPVSEYVRALNGILRHETSWEIVSYVLCFLPYQLSNKLFFRGERATKEVKALFRALCDLIPQDDRIERRCKVHTYIKRPNVNAAVYQCLSILISYRDVLSRDECDDLIATFEMCIESNTVVAKPVIQALTLSIFELEQHVGKRLLTIIGKLRDINFTSGIAVHLLEFLLALGQNGNLFRNFTDGHYKDVFTLVVDYIGEHNARSDLSPDLETASARENYTLSQHVVGLAYNAIYVWFMALKLPLRPYLVKHIIAKLLQSRSRRVTIDEMAEVCLDWLARYTYGNADPKAASSFLSDMVMQDPREVEPPKTQSWLLGGSIITITAQSKSGWAKISSTRPTGSTEVIAKLENVPLVGLGEADADLTSLPAVLMANRKALVGSGEGSADAQEIVNQISSSDGPLQESFDQTSQQGFVWSGATPSQRRKDVSITPAYLAVELLSSYPNASLETPRGRLIPDEEKYLRALRNIESTAVIDTMKIGILYVGPGQKSETEILGNIDGSSLYLDFLAGLGRLIRLKGQVDVYVGGLNREDDSDGEYAYAWWDDLTQTVFHTATMMPNHNSDPTRAKKKRLIGNDYVKIIYNESGEDYEFDTLKTAFNFINIVVSPHTKPESNGPTPTSSTAPLELSTSTSTSQTQNLTGGMMDRSKDPYVIWGRDDYFKVIIQRTPGIPDFSPVGEHKIVSRETLPVFIRHVASLAHDMAARYTHIRDTRDPAQAEYITGWRHRLRAINRLRAQLPPVETVDPNDEARKEELLRDFTRVFSYKAPETKE